MAEVYQTVGAKKDIKCFNCGVSGGTANGATNYLHGFCLGRNPDKVTVMFGINDICRWVFSVNYKEDNALEVVRSAIKRYAEKTEYLVKSIIEYGAEPILCTPPPYDEYNERAEENLRCDSYMAECAEIVKALGEKYGCKVVDFRTPMLNMMTAKQPISPDRVHPNADGYHIMAQIFLYEMGEIEACDFDTPFALEEWNAARREVEKQIKWLDYVDYNAMLGKHISEGWGVPEKIVACRERYETFENKETYVPSCYKFYIENSARREDLESELVKLTVYPRRINK